MRSLPILILTLSLLSMLMPGCRRGTEAVKPPVYVGGLTDSAWLAVDTGCDFEKVMEIQERAVELLREGKSREDPVAVLEQMAYFLFSKGDLEKAYAYFTEAEDSLLSRKWHDPTESAVMLYGDMSQFYHRLGMVEQAIEYSDSAMSVSQRLKGKLMPDLWRFRTQIFANDRRTAEAFACLDSAERSIRAYSAPEDTANMLAIIGGERANLILSLNPGPDSVALAMNILKRGNEYFDEMDFTEHMGVWGYALYLNGHKEEGIRYMETAIERLREMGDLEMSLLETRRLIDVYNAERLDSKVRALYPEYSLLTDSMNRIHRNIDYVTEKVRASIATAQKENDELKGSLQAQRRHKVFVIVALSVMSIVFILVLLLMIRKMKRRLNRDRERRLSAEAGIEAAQRERDAALKRIENIKNISEADNELLRLKDNVGKHAGAFRRAFDARYPNFVEDLRGEYPSLTDTDLTFCTLIYLQCGSDEIAESLNISRASVNSARYRIRTKLMLAKEENLDKFLRGRTE